MKEVAKLSSFVYDRIGANLGLKHRFSLNSKDSEE